MRPWITPSDVFQSVATHTMAASCIARQLMRSGSRPSRLIQPQTAPCVMQTRHVQLSARSWPAFVSSRLTQSTLCHLRTTSRSAKFAVYSAVSVPERVRACGERELPGTHRPVSPCSIVNLLRTDAPTSVHAERQAAVCEEGCRAAHSQQALQSNRGAIGMARQRQLRQGMLRKTAWSSAAAKHRP